MSEGFMRSVFFFFVVFLCVSCGYAGLEGGGQNECYFRVDRGFVVKWKELPVPVYIHESVSDLARNNFVYAMDMWNESWNYYTGKGRLFELMGEVQLERTPNKKDDGDGVNVLFIDRREKILTPVQQGSTHIRNYFGGTIYEGDIVVNNIHYKYYYEQKSFDYSVYTKVPELSTQRSLASTSPESFWRQFLYAFRSVLNFISFWKDKASRFPAAREPPISKKEVDFISLALHEFGHLAAMVHIDHTLSIMNSKLKKGQIRRDIGELELKNLACGYKD